MSKAIASLTNDHQIILSILDGFSRMLDSLQTTTPPQASDFETLVDFLVLFVDQNHHGKEEGLLFPALIAAGIPDRGGPVGVMVAEHMQGRALVQDIKTALEISTVEVPFESTARNYIDLLKGHIYKENTVLFPMADRILGEAELEGIFMGFQEHEVRVLINDRLRQLHSKVDVLLSKYGR